jgi:tetratricopeptide (TPR) repeat protein
MSLPILPVYVSSTWLDLEPERKAVEQAVQRLRETKFVGMEYFGSRDENTRRASLVEVDHTAESNTRGVYVGIFAARYGSGITEDEYRRARKLGLPCFIYFKADATIPDNSREKDPANAAKLDALKQELRANHIIDPDFTNPDNLAAKLTADLHRWLSDNPALLAQLTARHQLRAPVGDFVGREKEIEELLATLRDGGSAAITGISGMGGIGKTELSLYVANKLRDAYPDAQLVLDMRGTDERPRDAGDTLAACIRAFHGLDTRLPDDIEELKRLYLSVLEGKRALILLDNARDSAQVRPLMPPVGSALLITSRNVITLPRMTRVTLDQLSPTEARELLRTIVPRVPGDMADRICFLCGYLPLAIRAAGSLLDVTFDLAPSDYADELSEERTRLELIGKEGVDLGVEASFGLSYARLALDAALVFRRLAVFPATFDARAEETICEDPGHKHLSELLRRNLVRYNEETQRYSLHDLARLFADSRMSDDESHATRLRHAAHYLTVLEECNALYKKGGDAIKSGITLFDVERRNIEAGQEWACQHSSGDEAAARLCDKYPNAGLYILLLRQHPRESISWLEAALAAARQLKHRASEEAHLGNLGIAYSHLGQTRRAIELYEQGLVIVREIGYRRDEGNALCGLGTVYKDLGETQRAIKFYEQALIVSREIGDRLCEGNTLGNLGNAYADLGETRRAVEFYEQQLTIAREVGDRRGEANARFNTSLALDKLGDRAKAIAHVEAALEILEQIESPSAEKARVVLARWRGEA